MNLKIQTVELKSNILIFYASCCLLFVRLQLTTFSNIRKLRELIALKLPLIHYFTNFYAVNDLKIIKYTIPYTYSINI